MDGITDGRGSSDLRFALDLEATRDRDLALLLINLFLLILLTLFFLRLLTELGVRGFGDAKISQPQILTRWTIYFWLLFSNFWTSFLVILDTDNFCYEFRCLNIHKFTLTYSAISDFSLYILPSKYSQWRTKRELKLTKMAVTQLFSQGMVSSSL